jgi:thiol-disulfide isomerase/thioredoxin
MIPFRAAAIAFVLVTPAIVSAQTAGDREALGAFAATHARPAARQQARPPVLTGKRAPALQIKLWLNTTGPPRVEDRAVLIDFWARNCGPCIAAFPKLVDLSKRFASRPLAVVTIHPETAGQKEKGLAGFDVFVARPAESILPSFLSQKGMHLPVGIDGDGATSRAFGVHGVPTYILVGRDGIVQVESHRLPTDEQIEQALARRPARERDGSR